MSQDRDERALHRLLEVIDHPPPDVALEDIVARARRRPVPWARAAAVLLLGLATAGGAYALAVSPLGRWVADAVRGAPGATAPGPPADEAVGAGGGLLLAATEPVLLEVEAPTGGSLRVIPTAQGEVEVRVAAGQARFSSEPARLRVELLRDGVLEVRVPGAAQRVEIHGGERRLYLHTGGATVAETEASMDGSYTFRLTPGG